MDRTSETPLEAGLVIDDGDAAPVYGRGDYQSSRQGERLPPSPPPNISDLLKANLSRIFCEKDPDLRSEAIQCLWHATPSIYDGQRSGEGQSALIECVMRFQKRIGDESCEPLGPVSSHEGFHMLRWIVRRKSERMVSGCHLASVRNGRIDSCYLFID